MVRRRRNGKRSSALATRAYVKNLLNADIESKNVAGSSNVNVSTTLYALELLGNLMGEQDATSSGFIGKEIRLQSLFMSLHLAQANTHPNGDVIRVMVVEPRENYTPQSGTSAGIFFDSAHPLSSTPNYDCLRRVYFDKTYILNQPNNNHKELIRKVNFNLRNASVKFSTVAQPGSGTVNTMDREIWLIAVSDSVVTNSSHPEMDAWFKLRYKDA